MLGRLRTHLALIRLAALLAAIATSGMALDSKSPTSDYLRTDFTVENGLPSNVLNAIVQTHNGFLWLGTDAGLARFNGSQFLPIYFRLPPPAPQGVVQALAEGPNGELWVGTGAGLVRIARPALDYFDRSLASFYHLGPGSSDEITCIQATKTGELWVGTNDGLYRLQGGAFVSILPGVISQLKEAAAGHLLIVTQGRFVEWNGTRIIEHTDLAQGLGIGAEGVIDVMQDRRGVNWICTLGGLSTNKGSNFSRFYGFSGESKKLENAHRAYEDDEGNVWVQFSEGLYRVSADKPGSRDLLILSAARTIYSDRDGDLWVGTNGDGLMRFKDRVVNMFTKEQGLPNNTTMTVLKRRDGSMWVGNNCGGLSVFDRGRFRTYAEKDGLSNSCVWALAEDVQENLWVGTWGGGVFRLSNGRFTQFSKVQGLAGNVVRGITVAQDDSLWLATDIGVSHFVSGVFKNYTVRDGLSSDRVLDVRQTHDGDIWVATSAGINRKIGERFLAVTTPEKIVDSHSIHFFESLSRELYSTGAPKGLDLVTKDRLINVNQNLNFFGMLEFRQDFWLAGVNGIFRFAANALAPKDREETPVDYTSFGVADGMNSIQCSIGTPNMAITREGKLWVATVKGLAELDLNRLPVSRNKPALWVSEVTIGRVKQVGGRELMVPPGTHHTELHFDSVSLNSPEKIKFQYRMDGIDPVWLDADRSLTAVYTNIPAGRHLFHVRASNSDGIWDPVGIAYPVTQEPYAYETVWFRLAAVATLVLLLAIAYRFRLKQIAQQYNIRLDERVTERTRIARELHDTLLQSFHGLMLRFQAVQNMLPEEPVKARQSLQTAIDRAAQAVTEGRDAVQELRGAGLYGTDVVETLTSAGREMALEQAAAEDARPPVAFRVLVEGEPRPLQMALRSDLHSIGKEVLANAFRHARAGHIELDISYGHRILRLRIRDDGIGMDPEFLAQGGREGHWGLPGIRERARAIGGNLEVWSELSRGTEVELTLPAKVAYERPRHPSSGALKNEEGPGA